MYLVNYIMNFDSKIFSKGKIFDVAKSSIYFPVENKIGNYKIKEEVLIYKQNITLTVKSILSNAMFHLLDTTRVQTYIWFHVNLWNKIALYWKTVAYNFFLKMISIFKPIVYHLTFKIKRTKVIIV